MNKDFFSYPLRLTPPRPVKSIDMPSTPTRRVKVTVNGKAYVVEVGDLAASPTTVIVNGRPYLVNIESARPEIVSADTPAVALESVARSPSIPDRAPLPPSPAGLLVTQIQSPMPGNILDIAVKPGDRVRYGQPLCALEAMKMKSAIRSPRDGVVSTVEVTDGQAVAHGDLLFTFE